MLAPQHIRTFFVTAVAWQRRAIFRAAPMAGLFLDTLQRYRAQHKFLLHEFVLMPDHVHLLLTPAPDVSLEKAVQLIKGGFSFRVKRELDSNLEVWEKGYTEHRVKDASDYDRHSEYIRENPIVRWPVGNRLGLSVWLRISPRRHRSHPSVAKASVRNGPRFTTLKRGASTQTRR